MDRRDGLFDVKVVAKYPRNALKSETIINCQLTLPGTDYSKKQETVYYGKQSFLSPFLSLLNSINATQLFVDYTEQEPAEQSDHDSDEEADLVLSLETETGLLTNQQTKGNKIELRLIDAAS